MRATWGLLVVAGCGGAPFVPGTVAVPLEGAVVPTVPTAAENVPDAGAFEADVGTLDAGPDVAALEASVPDAGAFEAGADADAGPGAETPEASTDAHAEVSTPDAKAHDAQPICVPIPPTVFGCGISTYTFPAQYCAFPMDSVTIGLPTPPECQCAGHYTCECVAAMDPCGPTGQTFVSCQVGTTFEVVVVCK